MIWDLVVNAPEEVVVLLVWYSHLEVKAVWLHCVPALLPLHSLAELLLSHLANVVHSGLADSLDSGDLLGVIYHRLEHQGLCTGMTFV